MDEFAAVLNWLSIVAALAAAILWLKASTILVKVGDPRSEGGFIRKDVDMYSTAKHQSRWNAWAAVATAFSVGLQAASQIVLRLGLS